MLVGPVHKTLRDKLDELPDEFYLTGSQFFVGEGNDVDYFVLYSLELERKLIDLGFARISMIKYADSNCRLVMRCVENHLQVDIQLVENIQAKFRVQEVFKKLGHQHPSKEEWNLMFRLYYSGYFSPKEL